MQGSPARDEQQELAVLAGPSYLTPGRGAPVRFREGNRRVQGTGLATAPVGGLQLAHEVDILHKDPGDERLFKQQRVSPHAGLEEDGG